MFRTSASRSFLRPLVKANASLTYSQRPALRTYAKNVLQQTTPRGNSVETLAVAVYRRNTSLIRSYATVPGTIRDPEQERKAREAVIRPTPDEVSATSSMTPVIAPSENDDKDVDMMAGIRHDLRVIQDTFALHEVPTEAYRIGLAGVLPYLATAGATVICSLELNDAAHHGGMGVLMSETTANLLLEVLEPLQVGYGAVILSFLGAIHWGLEWAQYGGVGGYRRYAIGVIAPAVAWPTILFPVEYALITQFLAFNILYAVDSNTTVRGWTPPWYSSYRFLLTFIVGASIVLSLVARGQIVERTGSLPTAGDRIKQLTETHFAAETKETTKTTALDSEEEAEEDDDE